MPPDDYDRPPSGGAHTLLGLVIIIVLVVVGVVVLWKSTTSKSATKGSAATHHSTTTTSSVPAASTTTTTLVAPSAIKIQVLNGAAPTQPIASRWNNKLRTTYGYNTLAGDNATTTVTASAIYVVTPGYQGEASRLAAEVGITNPAAIFSSVTPSAPIPTRDATKPNLILVIGPDLANKA